ncbi:MAG: hypothetical protein ACTHLE_07495 [Agriterribacter sp.]
MRKFKLSLAGRYRLMSLNDRKIMKASVKPPPAPNIRSGGPTGSPIGPPEGQSDGALLLNKYSLNDIGFLFQPVSIRRRFLPGYRNHHL